MIASLTWCALVQGVEPTAEHCVMTEVLSSSVFSIQSAEHSSPCCSQRLRKTTQADTAFGTFSSKSPFILVGSATDT